MRFSLLSNPDAGRGRASAIAERFATKLVEAGHQVARGRVGSGAEDERDQISKTVAGADVAVVIGGDGTIHHLATTLIEQRVPVYHAPTGTENLFARQFGTDANPETLLDALRRERIADVDVGVLDGKPFLLMIGVGFDAAVIARLAAAREGPISHLSYLLPILRELVAPRQSSFTVRIDGEPVVERSAGQVIVGNSRQYAMRIDPAERAIMSDGMLDVVFFPARSRVGLVRWAIRSRLRRHTQSPRLVYKRGRVIEIESDDGDTPVQIDGEAAGTVGERASGRLVVSVNPGALRVVIGRSPGVGAGGCEA